MKTLLLTSTLALSLLGLTGCGHDEPRHTTVSTTEETEIHHPVSQSTTVETQQVRPGY